jgi:EAL domain-containing protein (putative c-di-GMP-specific phosphodiesterase class I)
MPNPQAALDRAFEEKNLVLFYQPIHDTESGAIIAAEALLRQRRESGEIREAGIITDAAEDGPELFRLDSWVVRNAYRDAAQWDRVRLNVNLSAREFQEGDVLGRLTSLLTTTHIDAQRINLEITETSYIDSPEETTHILDAVKKLGIRLWLDDFGTGHSSLEHLQRFPLDGLKIAAQFIAECVTDRRCRTITKAIIALAHELGLQVIAEGVEHREQLEFLREQRCEGVQGFLLSRPMELDELLRLLGH